MAKIDFTKVEQNISDAMHKTFVKKLVSGKQVHHNRAIRFFGHDVKKPSPQDSVIEAINDWRIEQALEESAEKKEGPAQEGRETESPAPTELMKPIVQTPESAEPEELPPEEAVTINPMFILRKHILWFIRKRVANIYKLLGTTKEEVVDFRRKKNLSDEDLARINEILAKAQEINRRLMKKLGLESDDAIVEKEKRKHTTRRFNIRDSWLPL